MANNAESQKKRLITKVAAALKSTAKKADGPTAERFAKHYFMHAPPSDLIDLGFTHLVAIASAHLKQAKNHCPGDESIRVFNPEAKKDGWDAAYTLIQIVNDDMPFLVDSITTELLSRELTVLHLFHPILTVCRKGKTGTLDGVAEIGSPAKDTARESFITVAIQRRPSDELKLIHDRLVGVLLDVRAAVEDWRTMRQTMSGIIEELEIGATGFTPEEVAESRDFLRWIHDNHFTFLGYRDYSFSGKGKTVRAKVDVDSGLGILRDASAVVFERAGDGAALAPEVTAFLRRPDLVIVTKTNRRSRVHRNVHMDSIGIKRLDRKGNVIGERLFVGLFTSVAYNRSPRDIPLLRRKVDHVVQRAGFTPSSHDGKALINILETFPRDELFQAEAEHVYETAVGVLHLQERARVKLFVRRDDFDRFVSCMVYVPRDRFNTDLRVRVQNILTAAYGGHVSAFYPHFGDSALARIHIIIGMDGQTIPDVDVAAVEGLIEATVRSWADHLREVLTKAHGEEIGFTLLRRYANAFPSGYRDDYGPKSALDDINLTEQVIASGEIGMNLYRSPDKSKVQFKLYHPESPIPLSDVLPIFEHMGFRVLNEHPHMVEPAGAMSVMIHDFGLVTKDGSTVNIDAVHDDFHDAFRRVWKGDMESDGFNALVVGSGLTSREVIVLRAYSKFLRQAGITFSQTYMEQTLAKNPGITRDIVDLFMLRFDTKRPANADKEEAKINKRILSALDDVSSADEDRILRRFANAVQSTLRTNFFQTAADGGPKACLSFKLASRELDEMPLPVPFREIFVYSPRIEGVHLRFGPVARGGLRWSDRREDFRTEVLGLVKAQQVKNAVIVPVGSKGGFVLKKIPTTGGRAAFMEEGIACYRIFISGLLDITDNLVGNKVKPPKDVIRHDGDDPYLVVAADKGTATFSDYANAVSIDYGHWLGDAFASGGSQGYDHKAMGITARGGWESVKRHFRELGKDIQKEDFTVAGVGDMGGDVFGNGMLLSEHICLQAAFNHLHIFLDPAPDAASSFKERKRLFETPGLAWSDYNTTLMSKGGQIYDRLAKSLKLTPEIKSMLGVTVDTITPNALMTAILKMPVELMWFGGIGTYIKATEESHAAVGDRANDAIRVNGKELGCQVIGEGANLGATQRGRIEYALNGGHLNTDSIDNSAGVDCSDHEVNIKILLNAAQQRGDLSVAKRNTLLAKMTDEVGELVLRHNYAQTQAISKVQSRGVAVIDNQRRLMRSLERMGRLNRAVEFLPDDDTLIEREKSKVGLTRPEISVLISYAKIWLYDELLASNLPDDGYLIDDLLAYFPTPLRKTYLADIKKHRLRREIIATRVTNSMVNRVGGTFVTEFIEKTGKSAADISRAYIIAREVFQVRTLWADIEALDNKAPSAAQTSMLLDVLHLMEWVTLWFLRSGAKGLDLNEHISAFSSGIAELAAAIDEVVPKHYLEDAKLRAQPHIDQGVPTNLAYRIANVVNLYSGCDIVRLAQKKSASVAYAAKVYFAIGTRFRLGRLRAAGEMAAGDSHWQQLAVAALIEEVYGHQLRMAEQVIDLAGPKEVNVESAIDVWVSAHREAVDATEILLNELWAVEVNDLAQIAVASRQLRAMTESA